MTVVILTLGSRLTSRNIASSEAKIIQHSHEMASEDPIWKRCASILLQIKTCPFPQASLVDLYESDMHPAWRVGKLMLMVQIWPTACVCMACELRMAFRFVKD